MISTTVDGTGSGLGTNITTADYSFDPTTCPYYLPCGYCKELAAFCLRESAMTISWVNENKGIDHNSMTIINKVENLTC